MKREQLTADELRGIDGWMRDCANRAQWMQERYHRSRGGIDGAEGTSCESQAWVHACTLLRALKRDADALCERLRALSAIAERKLERIDDLGIYRGTQAEGLVAAVRAHASAAEGGAA